MRSIMDVVTLPWLVSIVVLVGFSLRAPQRRRILSTTTAARKKAAPKWLDGVGGLSLISCAFLTAIVVAGALVLAFAP